MLNFKGLEKLIEDQRLSELKIIKNNMAKQKSFCFEVTLKFTQIADGKSKDEAIQQLKDSFEEEYNLEVDDSEIKEIK